MSLNFRRILCLLSLAQLHFATSVISSSSSHFFPFIVLSLYFDKTTSTTCRLQSHQAEQSVDYMMYSIFFIALLCLGEFFLLDLPFNISITFPWLVFYTHQCAVFGIILKITGERTAVSRTFCRFIFSICNVCNNRKHVNNTLTNAATLM